MRSRFTQLVFAIASMLLIAMYIYLNFSKLEVLPGHWSDIVSGSAAVTLELSLSGEPVFQQWLKESDIYGAAGKRQVHFVHLPEDIFARAQSEIETASLKVQRQDVTLSGTPDKSALLAVTDDRKIYFLKEGELKYMMTAIWNERLRSGNIIQCSTPGLCKSLNVSSKYWGPVLGPFSKTEFTPGLRSLPRGRWARGPRTVIDIRSAQKQKVWMQIDLLGVLEGQQVNFRGRGTQVRRLDTDSAPLDAAGRTLHPASYVLALDLEPGMNYVEMEFSKWEKPTLEGANPLAAYILAIGFREADR